MTIYFTKMHGIGNDFIIINASQQQVDLHAGFIQKISDRHKGIGFDQCLLVEKSNDENVDFFYRIFNANGKEVGQCGNGVRCLARYINAYGLSKKKKLAIATHTTKMNVFLNEDGSVTVDLGKPKLSPAEIPFEADTQQDIYVLPLSTGERSKIHVVNVGNPHAVTVLDNIKEVSIKTIGKEISEHRYFPEQCNVSFMKVLDPRQIQLRVYERDCGETLACGSGAAAAAAIGRLYYHLADKILVQLPGGELVVDWPDTQGSLYLTGPANFVYEGELLCD